MQNFEATSLRESSCLAIGMLVGLIILTCPAVLSANKQDSIIKVLSFVMALQVTAAALRSAGHWENVQPETAADRSYKS